MRITRDSAILWWGLISGVITALAANSGIFPPKWQAYISTAGMVVAAVSGWLKTSPLIGEKQAKAEDRKEAVADAKEVLRG
jgi:hypothetical protein